MMIVLRTSLLAFTLTALMACAPSGPASVADGAIDPDQPSARYAQQIGQGAAMIGPANRPGRWVMTRSVTLPATGWVTDQETGRSAAVELLPMDDLEAVADLISVAALSALGVAEPRFVILTLYRDRRSAGAPS